MTEGPTQAEFHNMDRAVRAAQTLIADPRSRNDLDLVREMLAEAYLPSPDYAILIAASTTAMRFTTLRDTLFGNPPRAEFAFPRDELIAAQAAPPSDSPVTVAECVELIESLLAGDDQIAQRVADLVDRDGETTFVALIGIANTMGQMLADMDPEVASLQDLIAQEGVDSEAGWLERGESYDDPADG